MPSLLRRFFYLRPMQFSTVIGQEQTKQHLAEMVSQNRLSHALLFLGKEGSGALAMALAFSQYILCEKIKPAQKASLSEQEPSLFGDGITTTPDSRLLTQDLELTAPDSCGICPSCQKARQLIHPDIHFTYPVITKKAGTAPVSTDYITEWREFIKNNPYGNVYDWLQFIGAENKQGNITAAECSDIIRKLNLKSYEGGHKILVLWMPEYLEKEGNKLLKLIEEPPPDTLFILVAENESLILPTIISRCQLVKLAPLDTSAVSTALVERAKLLLEQARQIASVCDGNYREALQIIQSIHLQDVVRLRDANQRCRFVDRRCLQQEPHQSPKLLHEQDTLMVDAAMLAQIPSAGLSRSHEQVADDAILQRVHIFDADDGQRLLPRSRSFGNGDSGLPCHPTKTACIDLANAPQALHLTLASQDAARMPTDSFQDLWQLASQLDDQRHARLI